MNTTERKYEKDIAILIAITLIIGIYLIATTVVISKDGIVYIERAQKLSTNAHEILNLNEPFGLPVLIAAFHHIFSSDDFPMSWILSAQICVLACRTLTVVVLYLFGTTLFSRQQSFWAVGVLIFLPYPAEYGADALREWPHLLFLFAGLLLLYQGVQKTSGIYLFWAGLICGLGHIIRPECAQVMLYGLVFFLYKFVSDIRKKLPIRRNWIYLCLAAGFLAVFLPYATHLENIAPEKLQDLYRQIKHSGMVCSPETTASFDSRSLLHAFRNLFGGIEENLMYYFVLPAVIGFYLLFLKSPRCRDDRRLLIGLFIGFYITALCLLDMRWGYISRRHVLPLTVMLCFYIPYGIEQIAYWLNRKKTLDEKNLQKWSIILISVGILISLPKLLTPMSYDKREYRQAARWIAENTKPNMCFYTFDNRIPFYADRKYRVYENAKGFYPDFKANYLIVLSENGKYQTPVPDNAELQRTFPLHSKSQELLIFKRIP